VSLCGRCGVFASAALVESSTASMASVALASVVGQRRIRILPAVASLVVEVAMAVVVVVVMAEAVRVFGRGSPLVERSVT